MILDAQLYRAALIQLGPDIAVFVEPPTEYLRWLNAKQLPSSLCDFLATCALQDRIRFPNGSGSMWPPDCIMRINDQEPAILNVGLLALGNAISDDFIVLDLTGEQRVGFVSHDAEG
jgi:hypothetical protein